MKPVSLHDDLAALSALHPNVCPLVVRLRDTCLDDADRMGLLALAGEQAGVGVYRSLGLLLKADWQANEDRAVGCGSAQGRWRPWQYADRFANCLAAAGARGAEADIELLVLEQCALSCHLLGLSDLAALAVRHQRTTETLTAAATADRIAFTEDQRRWLRDELLIDELLELRQQIVAELEAARMQYLAITGTVAVELVEAAQRLALMRYRLALNDPTLTLDELNLRLLEDLDLPEGARLALALEPELRLVLRDTARGLREDRQALSHLAELWHSGQARPADPEDQRSAARLFRRLARMLHPDALQQHPDYHAISPENRRRLAEIWYDASATHGTRVHLSQDKLLNYVQHLQAWLDEVERILRHLAFHAPTRLIAGDTLAEMHADLRRAMLEAQRCLHAVRDDIAALEFDPQHAEFRRVIALDGEGRLAERARMQTLAERWEREALTLETQLENRVSAAASADQVQMRKGAAP